MYNYGLSICWESISAFCVILLIVNVQVMRVELELDKLSSADGFSVLANGLYSRGMFFLPLLLIIIFSTEEKPKKRNEKECQSRSTEMREVCQGLR